MYTIRKQNSSSGTKRFEALEEVTGRFRPSTPPALADNAPHRELLSRADLRALGIRASNPTLLVWEADGRFPKRLTISPAKVAWLRHEVIAWIDAKVAARG